MVEDTITITYSDFIKELKKALDYGASIGYAECVNETLGHKPKTSNIDTALEFYITNIKKNINLNKL